MRATRPCPGRTDLRVLLSPRPNPSRHAALLSFDLPAPADVHMAIYDVTGRRIITLLEGPQAAGAQQTSWDGRDQQGRPAGAGFFFVRLQWNETVEARRLIRLR